MITVSYASTAFYIPEVPPFSLPTSPRNWMSEMVESLEAKSLANLPNELLM